MFEIILQSNKKEKENISPSISDGAKKYTNKVREKNILMVM